MLKKRDLNGQECHALFELMMHPDVFPYVRQKATSYDEFLFLTKQTIEAEERGELISRTILDEWGNPIGTINLFDIIADEGFLGTWIGKPYHGKGYNKLAKQAFFQELFFEREISTAYMRIRKENSRSRRAAEKLPFVMKANETKRDVFNRINRSKYIYDLYEVSRDLYTMTYRRLSSTINEDVQQIEA